MRNRGSESQEFAKGVREKLEAGHPAEKETPGSVRLHPIRHSPKCTQGPGRFQNCDTQDGDCPAGGRTDRPTDRPTDPRRSRAPTYWLW